MKNTTENHWLGVKLILRYIAGTSPLGLRITMKSSLHLVGFWTHTRHSTTSLCLFLRENCVSLASMKQHTLTKSSAEIEYWSFASLAIEITWITYILKDISMFLPRPIVLFINNLSALHIMVNLVFLDRKKWSKLIIILCEKSLFMELSSQSLFPHVASWGYI